MEKVVVYFSDIMGTILSNNNTSEDYQKFSHLLSTIKENEQADKIIFSLISTDNKKLVSNVQNMIDPFIGSTVSYGRQFFENGYYTKNETIQKGYSSKAEVIDEYLKELRKKYEITSIYYADDVEMYHIMLSFFAEDGGWNKQLHSIIPSGKIGLSEVNQLLESNIKKYFKKQK